MYLDRDVARLEAILFEHDLNHLLAVGEGVHGGLREQDLALAGIDLKLFREGIVPNLREFCIGQPRRWRSSIGGKGGRRTCSASSQLRTMPLSRG